MQSYVPFKDKNQDEEVKVKTTTTTTKKKQMHCTYRRTLGFSINGIHSGQHKHEPDQKSQEQNRIEHHPIRHPPRSHLHLDEISHPFPRQDGHVPQARRYVELHCAELRRRKRERKTKTGSNRRFRKSTLGSFGETQVRK